MKFYINTIFYLLVAGFLSAQTGTYYDYGNYSKQRVDSLRRLFKETQNDTVRMAVARDLGLYHGESDSDSSYYFHEIELKFAKKLDLKLWMADGNDMLGYVETKRGNYPVALQYFLEAVKLAENVSSEKKIWRVTKFSTDGNPRRARLTSLANIYNDFGLLYKTMGGREEKQRELFNKSINVAREINDYIVMSYTFGNLGDLYLELGKIDSAIQFHNQSLMYVNKANFYKYSGTSYVSLGNIYLGKKEYDSAFKYFQRTVDVGQTEENNSITGYGYIGFANLYRDTNQPDSGFYYARKAMDIYTKNGEPDGLFKAMESMVFLFRQKGQIDSAFYYQQLASAVKDSLHNTEKTKQFENIGFDQQLKVQELEKEKVVNQNRNRTYAFIAGSLVFLVVGLLLYRNNRQKQKANKVLEKTLLDLKATQSQLIQSEKMASLGELTAGIAHEIQNPLNFVNNFSEVSNELIDEMNEELNKGDIEEAKAISSGIKQNLEKINHHGKRADAIVKGMLQHSRRSSGTKEPTDINALADEYLRLAYHGLRAKDKSFNATMKTEYEEGLEKVNVIPQDIGRVILNLITNAFYTVTEKKNALTGSAGGETYEPIVEVITKKEKENVEIIVKDNGNGMPDHIKEKIFQPFFTTKPTGKGTGLGLSLAYDIVKSHGGELKVKTKEGEGCEFIIQLLI